MKRINQFQLLESYKDEQWVTVRKQHASSLPLRLRLLANQVIDTLDERLNYVPGSPYQKIEKKLDRLIDVCVGLPKADSQKLLCALFPQLGIYIWEGLNLLETAPYQWGYMRKGFRSPSNPNLIEIHQRKHAWLKQIFLLLIPYSQDIIWFAGWCGFVFGYTAQAASVVLAAALNQGDAAGSEVEQILKDIVAGEHEVGVLGSHIIMAFLLSNNEQLWDYVANLLRAAQRQEGLRQAILESIDFAHPEAFIKILRIVVEENMVRFSSVTRAVDVWLGFQLESAQQKEVRRIIEILLKLMTDADYLNENLNEGDPEMLYLALWVVAFEDVTAGVEHAKDFISSEQRQIRFVAYLILGHFEVSAAHPYLLKGLEDEDLQIAATAFLGLVANPWNNRLLKKTNLFEKLEAIYPRLPKQMERSGLVWPWMKTILNRSSVEGAMINFIGHRSPLKLIGYLSDFEPHNRAAVLRLLAKTINTNKKEIRAVLIARLADRSLYVREIAQTAIKKHVASNPLTPDEIIWIESLLKRKTADVRRSATTLLLSQKNRNVLASIERLYTAGTKGQKRAAVELIQEMLTEKRSPKRVRDLVEQIDLKSDLSAEEYVNVVSEEEKPKQVDGLGLFDPAKRTPVPTLTNPISTGTRKRQALFVNAEVKALIKNVDKWAGEHANRVVNKFGGQDQSEQELLVNLNNHNLPRLQHLPLEKYIQHFPLGEAFMDWFSTWREEADIASISIARALGLSGHFRSRMPNFGLMAAYQSQVSTVAEKIYGENIPEVEYPGLVGIYLGFIFYAKVCSEISAAAMIAHFEEILYHVPQEEIKALIVPQNQVGYPYHRGFRYERAILNWHNMVLHHAKNFGDQWGKEDWVRYYQLLRWFDEPIENAPRYLPQPSEVFSAYLNGAANEHDIYDVLMSDLTPNNHYYAHYHNRQLSNFSRLNVKLPEKYQFIHTFIETIRKRVLEVELYRGDLPTEASGIAMELSYSGGMDVLIELLARMEGLSFTRGYLFDSVSKSAVFSHLVRCTFPDAENDTHEKFKQAVEEKKISEKRLLETAMYAPQWAGHIEYTLAWEGLESAVWWLHAHTKDRLWNVEQAIQDAWAASIAKLTPLDAESLLEGAVDGRWFAEVYASLGEARWEKLYAAAKFASNGSGHARARLYADAMLGKLEYGTLCKRMLTKRYQDGAKAIGLLPLPGKRLDRENEILKRYQDLQEFLRTGKKYGAQRQQNERRSVELGIENLARTAGYDDPKRMVWKLEAQEVADLADGRYVVFAEDVELSLSITPWGEVEMEIIKENGRVLKNIPARIKKNEEVQYLLKLKDTVAKQGSRMRASLEDSMVRADLFSVPDLHDLVAHPVLRVLVSQLVFICDGDLGFPVAGKAFQLEGVDGKRHEIAADQYLRIAHPFDLMQSGSWRQWQEKCFREERIQPFKQIFRELYVLVEDEKHDQTTSKRYAGQQVQTRQAAGLLKSRLWAADDYAVHKTFHKVGITANVGLFIGWGTPAEIEGQSVETVWFTKKGLIGSMPLDDVPPIIFSEVMRDLDLVVSVAHAGGVDPEASLSTVEMRSALIIEMLKWMKIDNVELKAQWAIIKGKRADYNVHLGSGNVHLHPGGALCVVPVHSQHRGRLFLPFADNDPKTAEVVSKVLLFANDKEIKDPTILQQLLS
ncbi:MAG: DUF4132 domain-containing protein [Anaerolineales bacterium]|nr:DUF4132 domain-containing protein [Anaerolineales bacterium]